MAADETASTAPYNAPMFYGYIDFHGGYDSGSESGNYFDPPWEMWDESWDGSVVGGSARLAVRINPSVSVQGDVWANRYSLDGDGFDTCCGPYSWSFDGTYAGLGGHVTWHPNDNQSIGGLVSVGKHEDYGNYANFALEGVYEMGQWRFYGQVGRTIPISGYADLDNDRTWYAGGVVTYYHTPNLAISGSAGVESAEWDGSVSGDYSSVIWGARVDYKPENFPVVTYVAYRGRHWNATTTYPEDYSGTEHMVVVGIRVPLNTTSVQQMHHEAGLFDMNPVFGDPFAN